MYEDRVVYKAMPGGKMVRRVLRRADTARNAAGHGMRNRVAVQDLTRPLDPPGWAKRMGSRLRNADYRPAIAGAGGAAAGAAGGYAVSNRNSRVKKSAFIYSDEGNPMAISAFGVEDDRLSKAYTTSYDAARQAKRSAAKWKIMGPGQPLSLQRRAINASVDARSGWDKAYARAGKLPGEAVAGAKRLPGQAATAGRAGLAAVKLHPVSHGLVGAGAAAAGAAAGYGVAHHRRVQKAAWVPMRDRLAAPNGPAYAGGARFGPEEAFSVKRRMQQGGKDVKAGWGEAGRLGRAGVAAAKLHPVRAGAIGAGAAAVGGGVAYGSYRAGKHNRSKLDD